MQLSIIDPVLWIVVDFSRSDYHGPPMTDLVDILGYVKPTALLGLSTIKVSITHFSIELIR